MPTELRVHGVSGTPPAELLYTAPVTYDQGPDLAKVYEPSRDDWDVSVFHWGSLTSKSSLTALWILMAPFAMANVAGWMSESPNVWSRIWIRVAGLSLTGIFFAQIANMGLDLPYSTGTSHTAVTWIYGLVCVVLVLGLGLLSTQSTFATLTLSQRLRYLFVPGVGAMNPTLKTPDWTDPAAGAQLVGVSMWGVHSIVHRLRRLHLAFGMTVLAVVSALAVSNVVLANIGVGLAGVVMVALAFTSGPQADNRVVLWITTMVPVVAAGLLIWSVTSLATNDVVSTNLSVADDLTFDLALVLGIAAGLGLIGELLMSRLRGGLVPMGLLAVAALVGGTYGLTGAMLVEVYLSSTPTTALTFDGGAGFVTLAMLGLALVVGITFVAAMFIPDPDATESKVRRGVLRSRLILAVAGIYGGMVGVLAAYLACVGDSPGCTQADIPLPEWVIEDQANLVTLFGLPFDPTSMLGWAKLLMVAVPAALILRSILGGLLNGQDARRQVGILWDLGSFWPRWFHPLGPPAYGPYAVTRLQTIISEERPDVLSAHSQGAVICAVALCLTEHDAHPRLLITYGSQIGRLYPELFPGVGFEDLTSATDSQVHGRWLNLWRATDPIGGQVIDRIGERNWRVTGGQGHSQYELTPEFCAARKVTDDLSRPGDDVIADCWDR